MIRRKGVSFWLDRLNASPVPSDMLVLVKSVPTWLGGLLDFVYPPLCLGCGGFYDGESSVCERCLGAIQQLDDPICLNCLSVLSGATRCPVCAELSLPLFAYGVYAPPLKDIILQFKFKGVTKPAVLMASLIWSQFGARLTTLKPAVLAPIPLFPGRENQRGYNQAALLAKELAVLMETPVDESLIFRTEKRKPQASLRLRQRMRNIRGVFAAVPAGETPRRIILLDDVVTSGATVLEATRVLSEAGHEVVAVVSIAHGS